MAEKRKKDTGREEGPVEKKALSESEDIVEFPSTSKTSQESLPSTSAGNLQEEMDEESKGDEQEEGQEQEEEEQEEEEQEEQGEQGEQVEEEEEEEDVSEASQVTVRPAVERQESTHSIAHSSPQEAGHVSKSVKIIGIMRVEDSALFCYHLIDGEQTRTFTFDYPIYNDQTLGIYRRNVPLNRNYRIEFHEKRRITPEIYTTEDDVTSLNVSIFSQVLDSLSPEERTPRLPEGEEVMKVRIGSPSPKPRAVFLNLNRMIIRLVEYVLRISALRKIRIGQPFATVTSFDAGKMYFAVIEHERSLEFIRVKKADRSGTKLNSWKRNRKNERARKIRRIERRSLSDSEMENIKMQMERDIEEEENAVMCRAIDLGHRFMYDKRKVHPIKDISTELRAIPAQAMKVTVVCLDNYQYAFENMFTYLYLESELLKARAAFPDERLTGLEDGLAIETFNRRDRSEYPECATVYGEDDYDDDDSDDDLNVYGDD